MIGTGNFPGQEVIGTMVIGSLGEIIHLCARV